MSRLDELPPDQRAALSLLLREPKSYAQLAALLGISESSLHDRAHAALAMLAPAQARGLTSDERAEIGDYLLGQQEALAERLSTRSMLAASAPARAWALELARELDPIARTPLPEIPAPAATPVPDTTAAASSPAQPVPAQATRAPRSPGAPRFPRSPASLPSSRLGGALLLGGLLAGVIVAVVLLTSGGSSHPKKGSTTTSSASRKGPRISAQLALRPTNPGSKALALVEILTEGSKRAFYIAAEHLAPTHGFNYVIWLHNSSGASEPLSRTPAIGSNGRLTGGALLPANAGEYHEMLLTQETSSHPTQPGRIILRGPFSLS